MLMINESIYNHPFIHFTRKVQDVVGILVGAHGSKRDELWRVLIWPRILRKLKGFMLICGLFCLGFQSLRKVHGTKVLLFKRFKVKHWARGTRLKLTRGQCKLFNFIKMRDRVRLNEQGYKLHFLEQIVVHMKLLQWSFQARDRSGESIFPKFIIEAPL